MLGAFFSVLLIKEDTFLKILVCGNQDLSGIWISFAFNYKFVVYNCYWLSFNKILFYFSFILCLSRDWRLHMYY